MSQEQGLFERAVGGDRGALDCLVAIHRPLAHRIAVGILGDRDQAEDVAQDAMLRLSAALPGFQRAGELRPWVYRVTLNLCRDQLRRRRRRSRDLPLEAAAGHPELTDAPRPERTVDAERARRAVTEALKQLPDEQREVITLRFISGLPYAEIARITSTAQGTIASRVFRALKRLGELLDKRHLEVVE
ncbi:MAG: RNA polymerase sigma factor [Gemmatimonadales bacterium]